MTGPENPSFAARLAELVKAAPDAPAVSMGQTTLSRAELDRRSTRIARSLAARGLKAGDLLTIALPNCIAFLEVAIACWKLGMTPQPVSGRLPAVELDAIAELAGTPFIVAEGGLVAARPVVEPQTLLDESLDDSPLPDIVSACWKAPTSGGSTGRPKLILSGDAGVFQPAMGELWRLGADEVALMPAPLYHNAPLQDALYTLLCGGHLVLMPRFEPEAVLQEIEARRVSWIYLVPTMMSRIQRLPDAVRTGYDISSLKTLWHVAAPCPQWLKLAWIEWLGPEVIWEAYGATEGQAATVISGAEYLAKPGSVGRVFVGEIKVMGPDGVEARPGEIGEIYMRRPPGEAAPYRYIGAETVRIDGGWESVGDIGMIDADGYVFLSDRRSDLILVGGANVYPAEVEAALEEHPAVQSCAVVGLPDEDLGQRVHAIVQRRCEIAVAELEAHMAERLVRYKRPSSYEFVSEALRDDAGKVRRSQLRDARLGPPTN